MFTSRILKCYSTVTIMREKTTAARVSLDDILGDFRTFESANPTPKERESVTIWLSSEDKARYDKLQTASRRQFGKKARALLQALIAMAETKVS